MVIRQRKDWFDEEVSDQKRKVRREERKWISIANNNSGGYTIMKEIDIIT